MAGANSNIQITELDFDSIKSNFKNFLKSQDTLKDYNYEGSALSVLLDTLSYNTQYNAFYTNMVANEMFMDTALQRGSVVSHAKLLNYTPRSATAPQALVNLTINQVTPDVVLTLPKSTRFLSEAIDGVNYQFLTTEATTVPVVDNVATFSNITLKQGIASDYSYTVHVNVDPTAKYTFVDSTIDTSTLSVIVQKSGTDTTSDIYTLATDLLELNSESKVYFLQENTNGYFEIYFGNGIFGKQLAEGNVVKLSYISTSGTAAFGANSYVMLDTIGHFSDNVVDPIVSADAGSNKESITSIKYQAPKAYSSQGRAVTKEDYITILQQNKLGMSFDSVNVWGGEQNDPPTYGQVFICAKPSGTYTMTQTQKSRLIEDVIKPVSVMTVEPVLVDPDYTYLQFTVDVLYDTKKTALTSTQLADKIRTSLQSYSNKSLNTFNSDFSITDFQNVVKNVDASVLSNNFQVRVQKKFYPNITTPTTYKLYYGVPLQRNMFQSGVTSSPSVQYQNVLNANLTVNGVYIEEIPTSVGGIESGLIVNPGYGYQSAPTVTVLGDGTGATATATINAKGSIKAITITNKGSNYTSASFLITPVSGDTTGQQGSIVPILEGRYGTLRTYYNDTTNIKTILNSNIGTVDYQEGVITLNSFDPINVDNTLGQLTLAAAPSTNIISSTYNRIITVDPYDPNAIIVNVTAKK